MFSFAAFSALLLLSTPLVKACPGPGPGPCAPIDRHVINLDLPPKDRWTESVKAHKIAIGLLLDFLEATFALSAPKVSTELAAAAQKSLPQEYLEEMEGIADVLGYNLTYVIMANYFYEITGIAKTPLSATVAESCTSMVAQNANGTVFLARNQDYPPPFTSVVRPTPLISTPRLFSIPALPLSTLTRCLAFSDDSRCVPTEWHSGVRRNNLRWHHWPLHWHVACVSWLGCLDQRQRQSPHWHGPRPPKRTGIGCVVLFAHICCPRQPFSLILCGDFLSCQRRRRISDLRAAGG
jgi:hypothetical protein